MTTFFQLVPLILALYGCLYSAILHADCDHQNASRYQIESMADLTQAEKGCHVIPSPKNFTGAETDFAPSAQIDLELFWEQNRAAAQLWTLMAEEAKTQNISPIVKYFDRTKSWSVSIKNELQSLNQGIRNFFQTSWIKESDQPYLAAHPFYVWLVLEHLTTFPIFHKVAIDGQQEEIFYRKSAFYGQIRNSLPAPEFEQIRNNFLGSEIIDVFNIRAFLTHIKMADCGSYGIRPDLTMVILRNAAQRVFFATWQRYQKICPIISDTASSVKLGGLGFLYQDYEKAILSKAAFHYSHRKEIIQFIRQTHQATGLD